MISKQLDKQPFNQLQLVLVVRYLSEQERTLEFFKEFLGLGHFSTPELIDHPLIDLLSECIFIKICINLLDKFGEAPQSL